MINFKVKGDVGVGRDMNVTENNVSGDGNTVGAKGVQEDLNFIIRELRSVAGGENVADALIANRDKAEKGDSAAIGMVKGALSASEFLIPSLSPIIARVRDML